MDVSVGTLSQSNLLNEAIHEGVKLTIFRYSIDGGTSFEPLIHVAVVEGRPMVLALDGAGCHFEVAETVRAVLAVSIERFPRCVPCVPHLPHTCAVHDVENVAPETTRPAHSTHGKVVHLSLGTAAHVGETLGGESCCDTATNETY